MACRSILLFTEAKSWCKWLNCETVICRLHGGLLATVKGKKNALNDKDIYFNVLPNGVSCSFYYFIFCRYPFVLWYDSTLNTLYMLLVSQSQRWGSNFWGENSENSPCYFQWPHPCQYDDMIFTSKASTSASLSVIFFHVEKDYNLHKSEGSEFFFLF